MSFASVVVFGVLIAAMAASRSSTLASRKMRSVISARNIAFR
jgi:hypothetical protein